LLTKSDGRPITPSTFGRRWRALLAKTGVPAIRPHDLRHLNVSLLLDDGHNVKLVQQRAGHHSAAFTLDRYGHVMKGGQRQAAGAGGDALDRAQRPQFAPFAIRIATNERFASGKGKRSLVGPLERKTRFELATFSLARRWPGAQGHKAGRHFPCTDAGIHAR